MDHAHSPRIWDRLNDLQRSTVASAVNSVLGPPIQPIRSARLITRQLLKAKPFLRRGYNPAPNYSSAGIA